MNLLEQGYQNNINKCGMGGIGGDYAQRDYVQPLLKLPVPTPLKPTLGAKLTKVAEMYELELLCFDDALKAAEKAFTQHIKHDKP